MGLLLIAEVFQPVVRVVILLIDVCLIFWEKVVELHRKRKEFFSYSFVLGSAFICIFVWEVSISFGDFSIFGQLIFLLLVRFWYFIARISLFLVFYSWRSLRGFALSLRMNFYALWLQCWSLRNSYSTFWSCYITSLGIQYPFT